MSRDIDLVIFDCDGVIVDSVLAHFEVIAEDLRPRGLDMAPIALRDLLGAGGMAEVGQIARGLGADVPEDWHEIIYPLIFDRLRLGVPLIPGINETFDRLDGLQVPYCVGSNGRRDKMELMLDGSGVLERFGTSVFSAYSIGVWKPEPDLYLHAADQMGVHPDRCLVIEDSITGATAAKRAGMRCLGYAPDDTAEDLASAGALVIRRMTDVGVYVETGRLDQASA